MTPVLLINPNGSEAATESMLGIARRHLEHVVPWTNPEGPQMITEPAALALAGEQIARAEFPEAAGMIVAAFGDPGVDLLAQRAPCPVIGIGAAAALAAAEDGAAFAVVTTTPGLRGPIDTLMREKGGNGFLGTFLTEGDPLALLSDDAALDAGLYEAAMRACAAGAERVIVGGGPLAVAAERLAARIPVPLVQPLPEACRMLIQRLS